MILGLEAVNSRDAMIWDASCKMRANETIFQTRPEMDGMYLCMNSLPHKLCIKLLYCFLKNQFAHIFCSILFYYKFFPRLINMKYASRVLKVYGKMLSSQYYSIPSQLNWLCVMQSYMCQFLELPVLICFKIVRVDH